MFNGPRIYGEDDGADHDDDDDDDDDDDEDCTAMSTINVTFFGRGHYGDKEP